METRSFTYMSRHVDVVESTAVQLDGMKAFGRAVDYFEPNALLDGHVDQQWFVLQIDKRLEGHKLVIWFRCPRIDLDTVLECDHQKFNSVVFDYE